MFCSKLDTRNMVKTSDYLHLNNEYIFKHDTSSYLNVRISIYFFIFLHFYYRFYFWFVWWENFYALYIIKFIFLLIYVYIYICNTKSKCHPESTFHSVRMSHPITSLKLSGLIILSVPIQNLRNRLLKFDSRRMLHNI